MAKTIYLLQFNNYFNRTVKGPYSTVADYTNNGGTIVGQITNMSLWNPKNLTTNRYLTWAYAEPETLDGYPLITVTAN